MSHHSSPARSNNPVQGMTKGHGSRRNSGRTISLSLDEKTLQYMSVTDEACPTTALSASVTHSDLPELMSNSKNYWEPRDRFYWMWCLFCGQTALYIARTVMPVCSVFISKELDWDKKETGAVLGIFFWGYMTTQFLGGYLADRFGGENVITLAAFGWAGVTLFMPFLPTIAANKHHLMVMIILVRIFQGVCQGFHNPSVGSLMSHRVGLRERGTTFAFQAAGAHLGTLLCGSVGSILLENYGWRIPFVFSGIFTLCWTITTRRYLLKAKDPLDDVSSMPSMRDIAWSRLFKAPCFWAMLAGHYAHGHAYFILLSWLPTYFHDTYPTARAWVFNVVPWLVTIPAALCSGLTADYLIRSGYTVTFTRKFIVCVTLLGCAFFLLLMGSCNTYMSALTCMALAVACSGFHNSGVMLNPTDLAPDYGGAVFGIMNMAGALPGFLGVYLVGYVLEWTKSWLAVFNQTALVCIIGCIIYLLFGSGKRIL